MMKEYPCTCLPAPLDKPCDGCKRSVEILGMDLGSGPDRHVVARRDEQGHWVELTPTELEREFLETRRLEMERFLRTGSR